MRNRFLEAAAKLRIVRPGTLDVGHSTLRRAGSSDPRFAAAGDLLGILAIVVVVVALRPAPVAGQTGAAGPTAQKAGATRTWTPPRTPDGQPDLQGVWLIKTATPLERPKALEGRPFLTDEEVIELQKRADRIFKSGNSDFAAGDGVFMAALANVKEFKNPGSTHGATEMIDREFDNRTSLVTDPSDGRMPFLTPAAEQRQAATRAAAQRPPAGPEDLSNALRCISWSVPRLGGRYGAGDLAYYRILQAPGYVVLLMETGDEARIIPLDGRPPLPGSIRQWKGDSRGRWEGNTLVVDTRNFSPKSNFMGSAAGLHLVERFTRVAADTIQYQMTIDDLTTWTTPWTAMVPLRQTSEKLYEYACHEGNYEIMTGMLSAARADDKAAEEAAKKNSR
jgi:hypothetical protein